MRNKTPLLRCGFAFRAMAHGVAAVTATCLALFACASSACAAVPIVLDSPSVGAQRTPGPIVGARFGVDVKALRTSRDLPQPGSPEHEQLRAFLVQELNVTSRADPKAGTVLPTSVYIGIDLPPFERRERFQVGLTTTLPNGLAVRTAVGDAFDLKPVWSGSPCWAIPSCLPWPLALVGVGVFVALGASGNLYDRADPHRAVRLSNVLQRAVEKHALAVWMEFDGGKLAPVELPPEADGGTW